jgi:transcriptional regulator with XRE-family HTH domain
VSQGLSVSELARRSDVSQSFLSQVESGDSDISVGRLLRLAHALSVDVADLLGRAAIARGSVVRKHERVELPTPSDGLRLELLAPSLDHSRTNALGSLRAGATVEPSQSTRGSETFVYLLKGRAQIELRTGTTIDLRPGDSVTYPSEDFARMTNPGGQDSLFIWVETPLRA